MDSSSTDGSSWMQNCLKVGAERHFWKGQTNKHSLFKNRVCSLDFPQSRQEPEPGSSAGITLLGCRIPFEIPTP